MHIFNQDKKPYLIITKDELLFRENPSDKDMQRHQFTSIEKISLGHRHDPKQKLDVWLEVKMKEVDKPLIVQISSLDNPLEDTLSHLKSFLDQKVLLDLPSELSTKKTQNKRGNKKLILLALVLMLIGLSVFHTLFPPTFEDLKQNHLMALYKSDDSLCSAKADVAYQSTQKELITVNSYCGVLGTWYLQSQKSIPKEHLETEFSQLNYSDYISKAKQQINNKDYRSSIVSLKKAIYLDPSDPQAYLLLAQTYYLNGNKTLALKNNQKVLDLNPNSSKAHKAIALIYAEKENYEQAQEHYAKSVQLDATAQGYILLAHTELKLGETEQAITNFENSLEHDGNNTLVLSKLGLLYWENKAYAKAAKVFEKAYALAPDKSSHFLNYYEISLIQPTPLNKQDKESFIQTYSRFESALMVYDALRIIELSIKQEDFLPALKQWDEIYSDQKLNWSFAQLLSWLDTSTMNEDDKHRIKRTIGFFIAYQQIYNLEHQETLTGERL